MEDRNGILRYLGAEQIALNSLFSLAGRTDLWTCLSDEHWINTSTRFGSVWKCENLVNVDTGQALNINNEYSIETNKRWVDKSWTKERFTSGGG